MRETGKVYLGVTEPPPERPSRASKHDEQIHIPRTDPVFVTIGVSSRMLGSCGVGVRIIEAGRSQEDRCDSPSS
jgi:hypothetical protein